LISDKWVLKTEGFEEYGWSPTGVKALDGVICKYYLWVHNTKESKNTSKSRLHLQYQSIKPISIFSAASAVIQNAYQFGFGYEISENSF
jgi:long-chain fatty acid transport protein